MKKFLSLVLALVMTMSLVTVSAGAKDFTDNSKINYKEAVDVMSAAKVIDGYAEGDFRPANTLTRGAAAKIICNLILGPTTAEALVADAAPYSDVPTTNTFAGYIAYCAKEGIISGYADGTFRPAASLSGYAFMKMLLGALGYDATAEGYIGNNWSINVAKRALNVGLDDDLKGDFNGVKAVNREEACLYAFNTLKATMVEYENNNSVTVNGITFTNKSAAKDMENKAEVQTIKDDGKMQFAEKYFTDLKLYTKNMTDDFGRPANQWKVKSKEVGTYAKTADLTYTDEVKGKTVYADLGKGKIDHEDIELVVNGAPASDSLDSAFALNKNSDKKVGGKGTLTEVYFEENGDDKTVTIVEIETYLAQVNGDYDKDDEELDITFEESDVPSVDTTLSLDDLSNLADFEDEDYVLVTIAFDADKGKDGEHYVASITKAEKVTATVTSYTKNDSVTAGGTKYSYNATYNEGNGPVKYVIKDEYDLYLDTYGNVIYTDGVSADDNVVYISQAVKDGKLTGSKVVAAALFLDGSYKEITLNKDEDGDKFKDYTEKEIAAFASGWYEFKEKSDGSYDLKKKLDSENPTTKVGQKITEKDSIKVANIRATAKTQFIVTDAKDESGKAYTGIKNVPAITNPTNGDVAEVFIVMDGNYAKYVLIVLNDAKDKSTAKSGDLVYILESEPTDETVNENDDTIYTYDAIVNGKVTTVDVHQDADNADALTAGLYEDVVYTDKVITDLTKVKADGATFDDCEDYTIEKYVQGVKVTQKGSVVTFQDDDAATGNGYYLADDAKIMVVTVDAKGAYDEVKVVTAKKLASSDYAGKACTVTGVLNADGNFSYLFVDLH